MNNELALALFESIKDYSFLHSSPYLIQAIIIAIDNKLPGIGHFLDRRVKKYEGLHISTTQKKIKGSNKDEIP